MTRISFSTDHVKSFTLFADFEKKYGAKWGADFLKPIWEHATGKKAEETVKSKVKKVIVEPQNVTENESSSIEEEKDGEEGSKSNE